MKIIDKALEGNMELTKIFFMIICQMTSGMKSGCGFSPVGVEYIVGFPMKEHGNLIQAAEKRL